MLIFWLHSFDQFFTSEWPHESK